MRTAIAVHGRFHGFDLANELHRTGDLAQLLTTYPTAMAHRFVPDDLPVSSFALLEIIRRGHQMLRLPGRTDALIARQFGQWLARTLPMNIDILTGWSSATLEAIPVAQGRGTKVVIERGSTHILTQQAILDEAFRDHGLTFQGAQDEIIRRECAEYDLADAIAVPTSIAARSFMANGVPADKLIINPYGVSLDDFHPPAQPRPTRRRPRIVCVGRLGIRKGLPALLQAFARHSAQAELQLIGPADQEAADLLQRLPTDSVLQSGPLSRSAVIAALQNADIFCLPSIEEGLPLSLLQAMATGLPVIASRETGIETADPQGLAGLVVATNRIEALSDAMGTLIEDHQRRQQMGAAAQATVRKGFSWADYGTRTRAAYQKLILAN